MGSRVSHETYSSSNKDDDGHFYGAKFKDNYFAQGVSRYAFKGTLTGSGPKRGQTCVAKVFKAEYARNFDEWIPDLAASKKSQKFAEKFNEDCLPLLRNYCSVKEVDFLIPLIAKMQNISAFKLLWIFRISEDDRYVKPQEYVAIESFIQGNYEKFNSNGGYENGITHLLLAFCHWSWHISGHKFMIADLQGVERSGKFMLTDPAVHSAEQIYGITDLGIVGMEMVLASHTCNNICQILGLSNPMRGIRAGGGKRNTTYSFQLTEEQKLRNREKKSQYFPLLNAIME